MVRYQISEEPDHLKVKLEDTTGVQDQLLAAFQECQQGRCSCPTAEYEKLEGLEIEVSIDEIELRLKPKPGAQLEPSQIARCLDYTVTRTSEAH
jgi:hypothetical protein